MKPGGLWAAVRGARRIPFNPRLRTGPILVGMSLLDPSETNALLRDERLRKNYLIKD